MSPNHILESWILPVSCKLNHYAEIYTSVVIRPPEERAREYGTHASLIVARGKHGWRVLTLPFLDIRYNRRGQRA